ncbi:hypothetical protein M569_03133, partial [Genlisea aurea]
IQLYEVDHSDLLKLASEQPSDQRLESIRQALIRNLGRGGPGLVSVAGVSQGQSLRQHLLPLARKMALLNRDEQKRVLRDHNLGSDVPLKNLDRCVSSYAMQLKLGEQSRCIMAFDDGDFKSLGSKFRELGFLMMELGFSLARVCDKSLDGCEVEQALLQCGSAKGRLIHYHSIADNAKENLWQQWHYDYGIFTVLTSPLFLSVGVGLGDTVECESPDGHTHLQLFHPELKRVVKVKVSKGCFIIQVGEAGCLLSKGQLRATLHSVVRPTSAVNLSRETLAIFLQPSWNKILSASNLDDDDEGGSEIDAGINRIVPPLSWRLRDGMTFAEFARETTKQYYGSGGLQSS